MLQIGPDPPETAFETPLMMSGNADRYSHRIGNDDFSQPHAQCSGRPIPKVDPECGRGVARHVSIVERALAPAAR
jgi:hypothetical protein